MKAIDLRNKVEKIADKNKNINLQINNHNWDDIYEEMNDMGIKNIPTEKVENFFKNINIPTIIEKYDIFDLLDSL